MIAIAGGELARVTGAWGINMPVTVGSSNQVQAGAGTGWNLNIPITWGNKNHVTTGRGWTIPITIGRGNTVDQR